MDAARLQSHFVAVMAKHLPPSSSTLHLLDLDGRSGPMLAQARADLQLRHVQPVELAEREVAPGSVDAIVAYNVVLSDPLLAASLAALRAGGRLIAVQSRGSASASHLRKLRDRGFVRILIEPALDELGVLIRGEKPQIAADTLKRIQSVAQADADSLDLSQYRGRYIHLLIQQRPHAPAWKRDQSVPITWRAAVIQREPLPALLGFSSLPKAVGFMQPAVLAGRIKDINKVGKFSLATAQSWHWDLIMNPTLESINGAALAFIDIDPSIAEAPDE
ncbi:MAG: hypothetical protein OXG85_16170 [Chloroflexi bacterium]|nr:hypothetical protein [Chloroflexota bacterium]